MIPVSFAWRNLNDYNIMKYSDSLNKKRQLILQKIIILRVERFFFAVFTYLNLAEKRILALTQSSMPIASTFSFFATNSLPERMKNEFRS